MHETEFDKDKLFSLLEEVAAHGGISSVNQELLDASGCRDAQEFHRRMWSVYRILRVGRLRKDVMAAMVMLDMSEHRDEQPTYEPAQRLNIVKMYATKIRPQRAWRRGLRDIVDHFDAVVWAVERQP